jgi:phosphoenolpyruvate carboxykinase (ATP)
MDVAVRRLTLERLGLTRYGAVHENLPPARLIEAAIRRREGMLAGNGSLVAKTGKRTGRSPKDRFVIEDEVTRDRVAWGSVNKPMSPDEKVPSIAFDPGKISGRIAATPYD